MITLININNPIRSAIILYIIILTIIIIMKPKLIDMDYKENKYKFPLIVLIISIISYYIFTIIGWFNY